MRADRKPSTAAPAVARFDPIAAYIGSGEYVGDAKRAADGDYVLWSDYEAAQVRIKQLEAGYDKLRTVCNRLRAQLESNRERQDGDDLLDHAVGNGWE